MYKVTRIEKKTYGWFSWGIGQQPFRFVMWFGFQDDCGGRCWVGWSFGRFEVEFHL